MKFFFILLLSVFSVTAFCQPDSTKAPYEKFKNFPQVKFLLPDSSYFTKDDLKKKAPLMVMLFNPECDHCKHETEEIIKNIEKFEEAQILMVTSRPFETMKAFWEKYELAKYPNIIVTQDVHFFLITYFEIHQLPFLAFYDKKKEFISVFNGSMPIEKAIEELRK